MENGERPPLEQTDIDREKKQKAVAFAWENTLRRFNSGLDEWNENKRNFIRDRQAELQKEVGAIVNNEQPLRDHYALLAPAAVLAAINDAKNFIATGQLIISDYRLARAFPGLIKIMIYQKEERAGQISCSDLRREIDYARARIQRLFNEDPAINHLSGYLLDKYLRDFRELQKAEPFLVLGTRKDWQQLQLALIEMEQFENELSAELRRKKGAAK